MATIPECDHVPSDPQAILREALKQARRFLSPKRILGLVELYHKPHPPKYLSGKKVSLTERSLLAFIVDSNRMLKKEHYDLLERPLLRSPLARALRSLDKSSTIEMDKLVDAIASGDIYRPLDTDYTGTYFMYYGSYVSTTRFAIRVIEVSRGPAYSLDVTDSIKDLIKDQGRVRTSHGALTFFKEHPQFILRPKEHNETKIGLTFMAGNHPIIDQNGHVERLTGSFLTMTVGGHPVHRHWLMICEPNGNLEEMIAQSGPFTLQQIMQMPKHHAAFMSLKDSLPEQEVDQMFTYGGSA